MNINDVIALAHAGYTRDEIAALAQRAAEMQPAPVQQEQREQPAPVQQEPQEQPAPVQQEQPVYDMLALLTEKIDGLTNAYRAGNILNSQMPEVKRETAQDALASIIIPTYKKEA